jgi:hypothetical protein
VPERVWRKSFAAPISYCSVRLHCSVTCFGETTWAVSVVKRCGSNCDGKELRNDELTDIHCKEGSEECKVT